MADEETVYSIGKQLEQCRARLMADNEIPDKVKKEILKFTDRMAVQGKSKHRQYFYIERLKAVARVMGDAFLTPTEDDIQDAILKLQNTKTRRGEKYSDRTIDDIKMSLKKFYKEYQKGKYFSEGVDLLKMGTHPSKEKKPENVVTVSELKALLNACVNNRDRALISLLYGSGCRIGEILTMKVKDLVYDEYGMILSVTGKTGPRKVRVVGDAVPEMRQYQEYFERFEPEEHLFLKINSDIPMSWPDVSTMFYKVCKRAGIKRRIHPHMFRHTRATLLARDLKEAPLEATMGWVHGSKMSRVYVHLSDKDIDNAVLKVYGIEVNEEEDKSVEMQKPRICMRCHTVNASTSHYCSRCSLPLDSNVLTKADAELDNMIDSLQELKSIPAILKAVLKNLPKEARASTIHDVLSYIKSDVDLAKELRREVSSRKQ